MSTFICRIEEIDFKPSRSNIDEMCIVWSQGMKWLSRAPTRENSALEMIILPTMLELARKIKTNIGDRWQQKELSQKWKTTRLNHFQRLLNKNKFKVHQISNAIWAKSDLRIQEKQCKTHSIRSKCNKLYKFLFSVKIAILK